ncbi:MAG TPA: hypothetical protein VGM13_05340 [Thermoanaerobaculia bacterium]|jgi:hypothetical protein
MEISRGVRGRANGAAAARGLGVLVVLAGSVLALPVQANVFRIAWAEANLTPAGVSMYCGGCHDGSAATLPAVNRAGTHPVDRGGVTCLSCHRSTDGRKTPWRCVECHRDIFYGGSSAVAEFRRR